MWNLRRAIRTFAPALLVAVSAAMLSGPAQAGQVGAVKDGWLVMKVHSEMVDEDMLNGNNIDVDVKNSVVTLQGTVPSEAARARALAVAKANDGVKSVVDQLRIAPATRRAGTAGEGGRQGRGARRQERTADKTASAANKTGRAIDNSSIHRRSTRSTWPTGTPCSTTATSTSMSRTTSSR